MTIDDLKELLACTTDKELAQKLDRGVTALSNWRKEGRVPYSIEVKAKSIASGVGALSGDHNHITIGAVATTPELTIIAQMASGWDEKKRKRLLRLALEMDEDH